MPAPQRADVDDFFEHLDVTQRPYLDALRRLSRTAAPEAVEELKWNQPAYTMAGDRLWLLRAYKKHCSLRFPLRIVEAHRADVEVAGYDAGAGMLKIHFTEDVPEDLCLLLMKARVDEYRMTGATW